MTTSRRYPLILSLVVIGIFAGLGFLLWQQHSSNALLRRDLIENTEYLVRWEETLGKIRQAGPALNSGRERPTEVNIRHVLNSARRHGVTLRNMKPSRATPDRPASLRLEVRKTDLKPLVAFLAEAEKGPALVTGIWLSHSSTQYAWEARITFGCRP
ncbi:MAG: hypothetical protein ACYTGH_00100 [Planctomycetota bacterium]|jgi:hypothetical protein